ncbi:MAG: RluA family pseudouridine synthase [Clostridia bacterium]|nr:RluA family pseudouridine synthase [Clostridia bacterium]
MNRTERELSEIVSGEDGGKRLDVLLSEIAGVSRARAQAWIESGNVLLNGGACRKRDIVRAGDRLEYDLPDPEPIDCVPQDLPIDIVYEDDHLLVVNKPQGMVVHPAPGNPDGTLVNALLFHCGGRLSSINGKIRPGIVHRIDKDTAGLLIVAKTDEAHGGLAEQIAKHDFTRIYEAVCAGCLRDPSGVIDLPIGRSRTDRKKMAVVSSAEGRRAVTRYRTLGVNPAGTYSLVELTLETGRTHQIRVHLSHLGHPVAGDPVYGSDRHRLGLAGQCLFAKTIAFRHPVTGEELSFTAERPAFLTETIRKTGILETDG